MSKNAKIVLGAVVLLIVVGVVYFGSKNGASGNTYAFGVIAPFTGDAASYGEPTRNTIQLAVDEINNAGGINGKKLEPIFEDGQCNGNVAVNAMQKLVNVDKVQVVLGGFCSSETVPNVPIATQNKVLLLSASASSPDLTNSSPFFFRDYPSDATQGRVLADIAYNNKHWKKVAFIQEQLDYPLGIYNAFNEEFARLGGTTVKEEFAMGTNDFRSSLIKLKGENPDALFIDAQTPANIVRVLKQLQDLGWKPPLLVTDVIMGDPTTVSENKTALEGALGAEFGVDPTNPKFEHLVQAYKARFGTDMPYQSYEQAVYDAVYLIQGGITAVGYDGAKLAAWSRTINNWQGASGAITIESSGDRQSGHRPEIIHNGTVEPYHP